MILENISYTHNKNKMELVKYSNFETSCVSFTEPKKNKYGGKSVYVQYNDKPLVLQTPELTLPYGLNVYEVKDSSGNPTGKNEYSLNLSFKGYDTRKDVKLFLSKMKELGETIVDYAVDNSQKWFRKKHTKEVVEALNNSIVQYSKDKETGEVTNKWPPTMKVKLYTDDQDNFLCETYNKKHEPVPFRENVVKGTTVKGLMSCSGVWFAGGKFGVTWVMRQMVVNPPSRLSGYSFLPDSDDEEDGVADNTCNVEDTEEDEDDEAVVDADTVEMLVETVEEEKKPVKRVRRRKKKDTAESSNA